MSPIKETIEEDLKTLRNYCTYERLGGTTTMLWFYGLLARYPLEYLLYSRDTPFHTPYRAQAKARFTKHIEIKLEGILSSILNEEKVALLNQVMKKLESLNI